MIPIVSTTGSAGVSKLVNRWISRRSSIRRKARKRSVKNVCGKIMALTSMIVQSIAAETGISVKGDGAACSTEKKWRRRCIRKIGLYSTASINESRKENPDEMHKWGFNEARENSRRKRRETGQIFYLIYVQSFTEWDLSGGMVRGWMMKNFVVGEPIHHGFQWNKKKSSLSHRRWKIRLVRGRSYYPPKICAKKVFLTRFPLFKIKIRGDLTVD